MPRKILARGPILGQTFVVSRNILPVVLALGFSLAACSASPSDPDSSEAADLTAAPEIGLISDLDDTLIPKATVDLSKPPVPGIAALFDTLEHRKSGKDGDVYYVTARTPARVADVPAYLATNGVPAGPIETGTSGAPFIAIPEKEKDIEKILAATGTQRFVLFGDSTHVDGFVQQNILAKHPDRVIAGIILKATPTVAPAEVKGLHLVNSYAEAAAVLYGLGTITKTEARAVMKAAQDQGLAITTAEMNALLD